MTNLHYQDVTEFDCGRPIEVTNCNPTSKDCTWLKKYLRSIDHESERPFKVFFSKRINGESYKYARVVDNARRVSK
jgi:hypothetical protein